MKHPCRAARALLDAAKTRTPRHTIAFAAARAAPDRTPSRVCLRAREGGEGRRPWAPRCGFAPDALELPVFPTPLNAKMQHITDFQAKPAKDDRLPA